MFQYKGSQTCLSAKYIPVLHIPDDLNEVNWYQPASDSLNAQLTFGKKWQTKLMNLEWPNTVSHIHCVVKITCYCIEKNTLNTAHLILMF